MDAGKILEYFHHIHHEDDDHKVHHCGGNHCKIDDDLDYEIEHCKCGLHKISKKVAIGHDFNYDKIKFEFNQECPEGGWHLESGTIIE